jgi:hypothetical protein
MRAITASGTVPSTMLGSTRCDRAERKAPSSPDSQASMTMRPVRGAMSNSSAMRPDTGSAKSGAMSRIATEKNMISSRPHQKMGIE